LLNAVYNALNIKKLAWYLLADLNEQSLLALNELWAKNTPAFIKTLSHFDNLKGFFEGRCDDNVIYLLLLLLLKSKIETALIKKPNTPEDPIIQKFLDHQTLFSFK
jgi:hypothetical protein